MQIFTVPKSSEDVAHANASTCDAFASISRIKYNPEAHKLYFVRQGVFIESPQKMGWDADCVSFQSQRRRSAVFQREGVPYRGTLLFLMESHTREKGAGSPLNFSYSMRRPRPNVGFTAPCVCIPLLYFFSGNSIFVSFTKRLRAFLRILFPFTGVN